VLSLFSGMNSTAHMLFSPKQHFHAFAAERLKKRFFHAVKPISIVFISGKC